MNKKAVIIAVSAILIIALAGVGIIGVVTKVVIDNKQADTTVTAAVPGGSENEPGSQNGETVTENVSETTAAPSLSELIIGKWTDSANMSGYEFFADGTVNVTYVNLTVPIINIPVNGTAKGTYTLEGDTLTTKFSIYSATIDDTYRVSVENNTLTMYDLKEHENATYSRDNSQSEATSSQNNGEGHGDETELVGSWTNSDGSVKYSFNRDNTVDMSFTDAVIPSVSSKPISGSYKGVYVTDGNTVTIQYSVDSKKITDEFEYTTAKNTLTLRSDSDTTLFIREGTAEAPSSTAGGVLGKWTDGANLSGYEFKEGGVVVVSYVNFTVPVINMPINGSFTGSYSIDGNQISINYSVYGKAINDVFTYTISENALNLTDSEGKTTTYIKQ